MPVYWRRGGSAAFDLLLQNSSITKRCFVILSKANQRSTPGGAKVKDLNANQWKEMFRCAQHDSNVIQSTTRVPVILSKAKDLKKRKKRYLTFVRYDTIRIPVILSIANQRSTLKSRISMQTNRKRCFATLNMTTMSSRTQSGGSQKAEEERSHVVRYDTIRVPVILSIAKELKTANLSF